MKRTLLLGLACTFLHAGMSLGQDSKLPPAWAPPPLPVIIQDTGTAPPPAFMDGTGIGSRPCGPRVWADSEFLLWWTKRAPVNTPLLTAATNQADPTSGQIGSANTSVLLGNQNYDLNQRYGGRFTLGGWFDSEGCIGMEGNYLFISPHSTTTTAGTSGAAGSPVVGIPFFNAGGAPPSQAFAALGGPPGPGLGAPTSNSSYLRLSNELQGGELNLIGRLYRTENLTLTGLAGFRYVNFNEELDFGSAGMQPATGVFIGFRDSFHATNNFYGGNLGLRGEYRLGNFFVEATGKVALGTMEQTMNISGSTTVVNPIGAGIPTGTSATGFFAQPSNIGRFNHNAFCVVPETDLKFGYNISRNIQAFVAYNFLYLSNVERPGTGIDHSVNLSQSALGGAGGTLVGPAAPTFSFSRSDFWAQGVSFGVQFKF